MTQLVSKMKITKMELIAQVEHLENLVVETREQWAALVTQTAAENQMLRLRMNECEALLKHYEQTMAVLLERMITERGALNTPITTENRAESGGFVERATQNEVNK